MRTAFEQYHFERVLVGRGDFAQSICGAEAGDASADYRYFLDVWVRVRSKTPCYDFATLRMCGAPDNYATQMSLTLTLSRQRERELEFSSAAHVSRDDRCHHLDEQRVVADGCGAFHPDSHFACDSRYFDIQVVQNL